MDDIDLILVPGLIRKDTFLIAEEFGIPCYKASTDAADLAMVLDLVDDLELSQSTPADKLIIEEKKKQALKFIEDFENDTEKREELLKKENNILVWNLPVGEDFPMRVLSEIASAPILSKEDLIKKALSIDTLNPKEIEAAVNHGIDMVLSLDNGNFEEILPLLKEKNVPAVILPTNFSEGYVPHTPKERVESMQKLVSNLDGLEVVCDLILDPVNSSSLVDSIIAFHDFHEVDKRPMFFGIGNVIELMDTDSVGANAVLAGIAMELGASILFTPEESGKTYGSVRELAIASKMMFLAKNRQSIPKDLGVDLLVFKDKKKRFDLKQDDNVPIVKQDAPIKFVRDKAGSFKIRVEHAISVKDSYIVATHFKKTKPTISFEGKRASEIYEEIIEKGLVTRLDHAAYLGKELEKAEIAMLTGKEYVQDFDLFKDPEEFIKQN